MAKKSKNSTLIRSIVSAAADAALSGVFSKINDEIKLLMGKAERKAYQVEEGLLEGLGLFLVLVMAGIFLVLGAYSFLLEYMGLTNAQAYLLVGAALLVLYLVLQGKSKRQLSRMAED